MQRAAQAVIVAVIAVACGFNPEPRLNTPRAFVQVRASVRVLFGSDAQPGLAAGAAPNVMTLAGTSGCASVALRVRFFNIVGTLLAPGSVPSLGECETDANGAFVCAQVDYTDIAEVLVALVDDVDNATNDCIVPTWSTYVPCGLIALRDADNASCGSGERLRDRVLEESEIGPVYVVATRAMQQWDTQGDPAVGVPSHNGGILTVVRDAAGQPLAAYKAYLPDDCRTGKLLCDPIEVGTGAYFTQVTTPMHTAVPLDTMAQVNGKNSFGAVDCSGQGLCFDSSPLKPFRAGELAGTESGVISLNLVDPVSVCEFPTKVQGFGVDPSVLACP